MARRTAHINAALALALASLSLLFLTLLLITQLADPIAHDEPRAHLPITTNTLIPVLCVPITALWLYITRKRCTDRAIRRYITEIAALICFFLIDTALRHPSILNSVSEITWYLYYLPIIFMPTLLFFCGLHMFRPKPTSATEAAKHTALAISSRAAPTST